jgi:hypothetical protein
MKNLRQQAEAETTSKPEVKVGKLQSRNTFESRHQESTDTDSAKVKISTLYLHILMKHLALVKFPKRSSKKCGESYCLLNYFSKKNRLLPFHRAQKTLEFQGPTPSHLPS